MLLVRGRERERDKERLCAAAARSRIHGFAKSLLTTESTDWDGLYCISILLLLVYVFLYVNVVAIKLGDTLLHTFVHELLVTPLAGRRKALSHVYAEGPYLFTAVKRFQPSSPPLNLPFLTFFHCTPTLTK